MASGTMPDESQFMAASQQSSAAESKQPMSSIPRAKQLDSKATSTSHATGRNHEYENSGATATNNYSVSGEYYQTSSPDETQYTNPPRAMMDPKQRSASSDVLPSNSAARSATSAKDASSSTTKYSGIATARGGLPKPSSRSASTPIGGMVAQQIARSNAGVQNLVKQFDQQNSQPAPKPRVPTYTRNQPSGYASRLRPVASADNNRSAIRPGQATREPFSTRMKSPQPTRTTQRSKYAAEDQHSNNILSSAARTSKPRRNSNASAGSPRLKNGVPDSPASPRRASRQPLFGEVVENDTGSRIAYGISDGAGHGRRSFDSNYQAYSPRKVVKSSSPGSSPTENYYLGNPSSLNPDDADSPSKSHGRSMSDSLMNDAGTQPLSSVLSPSASTSRSSSDAKYKATPKSRLPVKFKQGNAPAPASASRLNALSPEFSQRIPSRNGDRQPSLGRPYSPASTGYSARGTRGTLRNASKGPPSNVQAVISVPNPMKSPPSLRSSKKRDPVSSATTASSRNKKTEKLALQQPRSTSSRSESRTAGETRSSRPDSGQAPDYAAGRARVQRSMSLLKRAEERRVQEDEQQKKNLTLGNGEVHGTSENIAVSNEILPTLEENAATKPTLSSSASHDTELDLDADTTIAINAISPIHDMPGTFPDGHDSPDVDNQSTKSTDTGGTQFDNELQTEPPVLKQASHSMAETVYERFRAESTNAASDVSSDESLVQSAPQVQPVEQQDATFQTYFRGPPEEEEYDPFRSVSPRHSFSYAAHARSRSQNASPSVQNDYSPDSALDMERLMSRSQSPGESEAQTGYAYVEIPTAEVRSSEPNFVYPNFPASPPRSSMAQLPKLSTPGDSQTFYRPQMSESANANTDSPLPDEREMRFSGDYLRAASPTFAENRNNRPQTAGSDYYMFSPPPPPPKEALGEVKPAVPPKSAGYTPLTSHRSHDGAGDFPMSLGNSRHASFAAESYRGSTSSGQHPRSDIGRASGDNWTDKRDSPMSTHTEKFNARESGHSHNLYPSAAAGHNFGRESSETGQLRPSTSTARSSLFVSNESDNVQTPMSSNGQGPNELLRAPVAHSIPVEAFQKLFHRKHVITELIDTEAVFVKDMSVMVEIYQGTAEACPDLTPSDIKLMFRNSAEIIKVAEDLLADLKIACLEVYVHRSPKNKARDGDGSPIGKAEVAKLYETLSEDALREEWAKDRRTTLGATFMRHITALEHAYQIFLLRSNAAIDRMEALEKLPAVDVWLGECNVVAKDISNSWSLDSLLVKPVQRVTKYPLLLQQLLQDTPPDHPDYKNLSTAVEAITSSVMRINKEKSRVETVSQLLEEERKKSETATSGTNLKTIFTRNKESAIVQDRANEDPQFLRVCDKFNTEIAHLQLIMRDVDKHVDDLIRWVDDSLRMLSAMELVMRTSPSGYPEIESKWARFNLSMRDMGKIGLEKHKSTINKDVLEPIKSLIMQYSQIQATLALRNKRRPKFLEVERLQEKYKSEAKIDEKLTKKAQEYACLNNSLIVELPKLSKLNGKIIFFCLTKLVNSQAAWYSLWNEKLRTVLEAKDIPTSIQEIAERFVRDHSYHEQIAKEMSLTNGTLVASAKSRNSESTFRDESQRSKSRISTATDRARGLSINSEYPSSYLSPDPSIKAAGQSPFTATTNSSGVSIPQPIKRDTSSVPGPLHGPDLAERPDQWRSGHAFKNVADTRRSSMSSGMPRQSGESSRARSPAPTSSGPWIDGIAPDQAGFSDVFHSALPWSNSNEEAQETTTTSGPLEHHVPPTLYVVASLCPFHIDTEKMEAGYPYLTYMEGEIFDVVAEKGELWLAKNQDDTSGKLGWIWNQHFARISNDD